MSTLSPRRSDEVVDAVRDALAAGTPLEVRGHGTKRAWGNRSETNKILDLSGLSGVIFYEPDELVLSAKAGTPMAKIEALLAQNRQMLAFEPPFLFDTSEGDGEDAAPRARQDTLGGVIACNLSGPRRIKVGAARDHILGVKAVNGRGEAFQAGGRVMKNVTGYDLPKLLCGSFGTLAVLTEITVKVLPAPEKARTILVLGLSDADACAAMSAALNSPHDVSGAVHLPETVASRSRVSYVRQARQAVTAIRVEGFGPSVEARCQALRGLLVKWGVVEELHTGNSARLWREIRDVIPLLPDPGHDLWRLSVPPATGAAVVAQFGQLVGPNVFYDWGGGLIWVSTALRGEGLATVIRSASGPTGGHATILRSGGTGADSVPRFEPQPAPIADLSRRLRESFDPLGILNPGRMAPGA